MNEEHLAKVNSNSKSKEKIQLSKWREQACFWRQNSSYRRKWREQTCFSMFSRWRQISNSDRMRNICRNGARSEADLAQCVALALPPPFLFLWLLVLFDRLFKLISKLCKTLQTSRCKNTRKRQSTCSRKRWSKLY